MDNTRSGVAADFLAATLSAGQIRAMVATLPSGRELLAELPSDLMSSRVYATYVVDILERRGLIGKAFFDALRVALPKHEPQIRHIEAIYADHRSRDSLVYIPVSPDLALIPRDAAWLSSRPWVKVASFMLIVAIVAAISGLLMLFEISRLWRIVIIFVLYGLATLAEDRIRRLAVAALTAIARRRPGLAPPALPSPGRSPRDEATRVDSIGAHNVDPELVALTVEFFKAAGRTVILQKAHVLLAPDPVVIARNTPASARDITELDKTLGPERRGYFAYWEQIADEAAVLIDKLRLRGNPVATISASAMKSALTDQSCEQILGGIEHTFFQQHNLFLIQNALIERRLFFGRADLLNRVGASLSTGGQLLVTGLRKSGKTSFLHILRQQLTHHPWCWIDLQAFDLAQASRWPLHIFSEMVAAFDRWGVANFEDWPARPESPQGGPLRSTEEFEAAFRLRARWQAERGRGDKRMFVVLDEIERIFPREREDQLASNYLFLSGVLRALAQSQGRNIAIIAADLRPTVNRINVLADGRTNPFFQFFKEVPLPPLSLAEVRDLTVSTGRTMGISTFEDGFFEELHAYSGGHAYLTRLLAGTAYDCSPIDGGLSLADLRGGCDHLIENGIMDAFCRENIWVFLRDEEQAGVLRSLRGRDLKQRSSVYRSLRSFGLLDDSGLVMRAFKEWLEEDLLGSNAAPSEPPPSAPRRPP